MSEENSVVSEVQEVAAPVESDSLGEAALNSVNSTENLASKNEVKKAEANLRRKLMLKVDGEEIEEEIDLADEEGLKRHLQMSKVAQKRMQQYSTLEKQAKEFIDLLKKDPRRILSDPSIGIDLKQFATQIIEEEIAQSKKSPEQVEKEKMEAELRSLKEEREREREELKSKELERLQNQEAEKYDTQISKALEVENLPKSPYVVKKIADYLLVGLEAGLNLEPSDVIALVKEEIHNDIKEMFGAMPDELIEQMVGSDKINSIRKKKVAVAKENQKPAQVAKTTSESPSGKETKDGKKMTLREFFGA